MIQADAALKAQYYSAHDPYLLSVWQQATVGIAGAGGLGSNIAVSLARSGVGKLIISDFDVIVPANLNRQQFFIEQIGSPKVEALRDNLSRINPFIHIQVHNKRITPHNLDALYGECDILLEAFDVAEQKLMLIESWQALYPDKPIIIASGLAGYGHNDELRVQNLHPLYICGDCCSQLAEGISPIAPRVAIVANLQANLCLELLISMHKTHPIQEL